MPKRELSWQPGYTLSRKPAKRPTRRRNQPHRFEIIVEQPQTVHRAETEQASTNAAQNLGLSQNGSLHGASASGDASGEPVDYNELSIDQSLQALKSSDGLSHLPGGTCGPQDVVLAGPDTTPLAALPSTSSPSLALISPVLSTIQYTSLTERFRPILTRYNTEFCTIPLTFKLRINPFRYRADFDPEPQFLVHAVMALAGHHVKSTSMLAHRQAALQLLRQSICSLRDIEVMYSVLDTIVILFSLDETQSLLGNWNIHLMGAYTILEACGGIAKISLSSRIEAQIGILTWWDAIISLLSREDCVFPYQYFDAVLSNQDDREWDFFGLCGCPTAIVKIVMRIARLGTAKRQSHAQLDSASMSDAVSEIVQSLEAWCHVPTTTSTQDEEGMHEDMDVMHCSEMWRSGLLLYMFRVFQWKPGSSVPIHITYRARTVVDHASACRDNNMLSRQALLPLFFAGCELRDKSTQAEIVRLCSIWDQRTRYHMFRGAIPMLEQVWSALEIEGLENVWWGQIIDRQQSSKVYPLKTRICFG